VVATGKSMYLVSQSHSASAHTSSVDEQLVSCLSMFSAVTLLCWGRLQKAFCSLIVCQ